MDGIQQLFDCHGFWECLGKLVNPDSIIRHGGLLLLIIVVFAETGLLVGFFLPGDSLLFTAGLLSADPSFANSDSFLSLTIVNVLIFVTIAAVAGDSFGYYIGQRTGPKVFKKPKSLFFKPEYVLMTKEFYNKYGDKALILGRFLPIVRTFAPVMAGVVNLQYRRFIVYNVTGGVIWVFSLALAGYAAGVAFPAIQHYYHYIVIGMIVLTTIPIIRMIMAETKKSKQLAKQTGLANKPTSPEERLP
jgi:membrane-associated protein